MGFDPFAIFVNKFEQKLLYSARIALVMRLILLQRILISYGENLISLSKAQSFQTKAVVATMSVHIYPLSNC